MHFFSWSWTPLGIRESILAIRNWPEKSNMRGDAAEYVITVYKLISKKLFTMNFSHTDLVPSKTVRTKWDKIINLNGFPKNAKLAAILFQTERKIKKYCDPRARFEF